MAKIIIQGGVRLQGNIPISGAKNSALPILAACLLTDEECSIENVPNLVDVQTMLEVLEYLGTKIEKKMDAGKLGNTLIVKPNIKTHYAPYELVKRMRASFYVSGPLLARLGKAEVPLPGGCVIGSRPVNFHIQGFQALGAEVKVEYGYMKAKLNRLKGAYIYLDPRFCSVGTTMNIMMTSTLAEGKTIIENAAREPEVVDLGNFLIKMGADIKGVGTSTIEISGVRKLTGVEHRVIPDRIEAGTYLVAGAITGGDITLEGISGGYLEAVLMKLKEAGFEIKRDINRIRILKPQDIIKSVDITTAPYPGFPTDMQPALVTLMTVAQGASVIVETIHDSRFRYVDELRRMGANIRLIDNTAIVKGVPKLTGAPVEALDLRAGAALIIAGLRAEGETEVGGVEHIDRGYENLEKKLQEVGANIKRIE